MRPSFQRAATATRRVQVALAGLLVAGLLAVGCAPAEDYAVGETDQEVQADNRLALNRLALNRLALNRLALNRLALNRLALNRLALNALEADDLLATEAGRDLLEFATRCAIEEGIELVAEVDGETYTFFGQLGLVPEWLDSPLSESNRRWLTACLLAHVNYFEVSVAISLRGRHPALTTTKEERKEYRTQEGAFYGDMFADSPLYVSCIGKSPRGDASADLDYRVCATEVEDDETICGFASAGKCHKKDVCAVRSKVKKLGYSDCIVGPGQEESIEEVITVFLSNTEGDEDDDDEDDDD